MERLKHRQDALERIKTLHTDIEKSITQISEISARVADVGLSENSEASFEMYLGQLQELAKRAREFNIEVPH